MVCTDFDYISYSLLQLFRINDEIFGQTLGKMIFGLRVISLKHDKLTWSDVLFRDWIGRIINSIFMPLYILVGILPNNQGLHDFSQIQQLFMKKFILKRYCAILFANQRGKDCISTSRGKTRT